VAPSLDSNLRGQMVLLGTGTSVGVPVVGCGCKTCSSSDPRNQRLRCAVAVGLPQGTLLIDTPPDLRTQLLREKIGVIHTTLYTHDHADHVFGLDDLRIFSHYLQKPMPIYCEEAVEDRIRKSFDYAFATEAKNYGGGVPQLAFHRISTTPFEVLGQRIIPIRLHHGRFRVLGFRIGNVAYCTDTNHIPAESWSLLERLDVLVLDALRPNPHSTHFNLDQAIEAALQLKPRRTYFTHIAHEIEHGEISKQLPAGIELGYDGLRIPLTLFRPGERKKRPRRKLLGRLRVSAAGLVD
jgi:phosphoribosyl 1,2-cyclic phosphate phosphodiesterase